MAVEMVRKVIRAADTCLECGISGGFHEPTCLVYVLELEEYRDRLERALYRMWQGKAGYGD